MSARNTPAAAPLAYSVKSAAAALDLSVSTIAKLCADDVILSKFFGSKRLIPAAEVARFLDSLPYERE